LGLGDRMVSKLRLHRKGPVFVFEQDIFASDGSAVVRAVVEVASFENGRLSRGDRLASVFSKYL
ncbi:MAG: acyl-CoA thioesterase, partial [Muribaculaceae bacterium]|nr:acyl-CoA thioesterase [Muribaculaceae bacterium]